MSAIGLKQPCEYVAVTYLVVRVAQDIERVEFPTLQGLLVVLQEPSIIDQFPQVVSRFPPHRWTPRAPFEPKVGASFANASLVS